MRKLWHRLPTPSAARAWTICQGFIEAHDGHITVSNAHAEGAFTYALPVIEQVRIRS